MFQKKKNMKKYTIISIILNGILLITLIILFNNYFEVRNEFEIYKKTDSIKRENKEIARIVDKNDPIYIYNTHKFSRDTGYTSYDYNMNTGERLQFADSLLNKVVKDKIGMLEKYIKVDRDMVLKVKNNSFFVNALKVNIAQKENLIKSQELWRKMRLLNSENVRLGCDGATGCTGIVNDADIKYVLRRIEEIKDVNGYN
ncbi:hypothetical protein B0A81_02595 [Flavobacterium plurextorum]|uniref:Lysozyme inhibitor LprI N-terminal domain-containing protein n=2 Tax=Flavobacterium plurextorum TaxID=1114867 RepID=A0ABX4CYQ8_9FLAO|nr:hypothetical protein B0A81_02595 [Flavobacterium plurextorum]